VIGLIANDHNSAEVSVMLPRQIFRLRRFTPIISLLRLMSAPSSLCLVPIGQAQPLQESSYEPGQLILHRHFGCRGVILQSWSARLFDKNLALGADPPAKSTQATHQTIEEGPMPQPPSESGRSVYGYTVLLDSQDAALCNSSLVPGISFLPDDEGLFNTIYMMTGMDYAFHDDIIPYTSNNVLPLKNEYFEEFIRFDPNREPRFCPTDRLQRWLETRQSSLEMKTVYRETTEGVRVTVVPFLMGQRKFRYSEKTQNYYWRYLIRLENLTDECLQLRERFWKLFSINGSLESVSGKGVVGVQPLLPVQSPIFQYHSHVQVPVPWAHMWGQFRLEKRNGTTVDVKIPVFPLCVNGFQEDHGGGTTDSGDTTK
uniref:Polymerase delta interacting protein 2 n=2 Tax=Echinococcus granulosus TaxID=6210 RepID=A0A7E4SLV1_ECHGR